MNKPEATLLLNASLRLFAPITAAALLFALISVGVADESDHPGFRTDGSRGN